MDLFPLPVIAGISVVVASLIGGLAAGVAAFLFTPRPDAARRGNRGQSRNVRSAESPEEIVFGYVVKGGTLFFINGTGTDNTFLHLMLVVAGHEVAGIGDVRFNSEIVERNMVSPSANAVTNADIQSIRLITPRDVTTRFDNHHRLRRYTGTESQLADPDAVLENEVWTDAHRARSKAYVYERLTFDPDIFTSFIPEITCEVYGRNDIFDPRDASNGWSMNPALIVSWILENLLNIPREKIDQASLIEAANVCDERVMKLNGQEEPRYTANTTIELDGEWEKWIEPFVTAMAGACIEWNGTYYIRAGSWVEPDVTIRDEDLMGPISRRITESDDSRSNAVKGTYVSPASFDEPTEFPPYINEVALSEDMDLLRWLELDLQAVNSPSQAQRLAHIYLNENRTDETITLQVTLEKGFDLIPWDNVRFESDIFGIDQTYRVMEHTIVPATSNDGTVSVELVLKAHRQDIYEYDPTTDEKQVQNARSVLLENPTRNPVGPTYSRNYFSVENSNKSADYSISWAAASDPYPEYEINFTYYVEYLAIIGRIQTGYVGEFREVSEYVPMSEISLSMDIFSTPQTSFVNSSPYRNHNLSNMRIRSVDRINGLAGDWIEASL